MASLNSEIKHYLDNVRSEKSLDGMQRAWLEGLVSSSSPRSMNGLYHAYWDLLGIGGGSFNGRMRTWLYQRGYTQRSINAQLRDYWTSYPLDATTEVISHTDYDGYEVVGTGWKTEYLSGAKLGITGQIGGALQHTGYHYTTIPFKQGTQLTSAVIQVYCGWKNGTGAKLRFQCEDADNADAPSDASGKLITDRTLTTAYTDQVSGDFTASAVTNVNITTAVNEVLARPGWKPNNNLNVISMGTGSTNGEYISAALVGHANSNATPLVLTP